MSNHMLDTTLETYLYSEQFYSAFLFVTKWILLTSFEEKMRTVWKINQLIGQPSTINP
jgi:hypothetical protein